MKRELEGGWFQWVTMPLPAVLTIQSGINQLRYATLKGIMAAKKKEIRAVPAGPAAPKTKIAALYAPERQKRLSSSKARPRRPRKNSYDDYARKLVLFERLRITKARGNHEEDEKA